MSFFILSTKLSLFFAKANIKHRFTANPAAVQAGIPAKNNAPGPL